MTAGSPTSSLRDDYYSYDLAGNVTGVQSLLATQDGSTYTYDDLNRLATWTDLTSGAQTGYQYDNSGNLRWKKAKAGGGQDIELKYEGASKNAGPHAVTNMSGVGDFGYNARGEQVSTPDRTVEYTSFGLPSSITLHGASTMFQYDAENTRVSRKAADGSTTIIYTGGVYERRQTSSGTTHVFYIVAGGQVVAQLESDSAGVENMRYFHQDRLGTTIGTSDNGHNATFWRRDPWGQLLSNIEDAVRVGFTGHEDDLEFGLINMRGRIYDPRTTRFLTPDPIGGSLGSAAGNRYAYVLNNPTNMVDPLGFQESETSGEMLDWVTTVPAADGYIYGGTTVATPQQGPSGEEPVGILYDRFVPQELPPQVVTPQDQPPVQPPPVVDQTGSLSGVAQLSGTGTTPLPGLRSVGPAPSFGGDSGHLNDTSHRTTVLNGFYSGANPQCSMCTVIENVGTAVTPQSPTQFAAITIGGPLLGRALGPVLGKIAVIASSSRLAAALVKAGLSRPAQSAAHHIVAGAAEAAAPARQVLERFGIGIDEAVNGVFLPTAQHAALHTNEYYQAINSALAAAATREEAIGILDAIGQSLRGGGL